MTIQQANDILEHREDHWSPYIKEAEEVCIKSIGNLLKLDRTLSGKVIDILNKALETDFNEQHTCSECRFFCADVKFCKNLLNKRSWTEPDNDACIHFGRILDEEKEE